MNDLISVIIPVYNVEKYLDRCIISVLKQSYSNIEVILVDDGTQDSSGKICDKYAFTDSRVKVIHKTNGGLSDARNVGIAASNGKYIAFIDSDDFVSARYIEKLYYALLSADADISVCRKIIFYDESEVNAKEYDNSYNVITKKQFFDGYFTQHDQYIVAWNKLYPRDIFKKVIFPKGKYNEDAFTTYLFINEVERIAVLEDELYYYYQNPEGIVRSKIKNSKFDDLEAHTNSYTFFKEYGYVKTAKDNAKWLLEFYIKYLSEDEGKFVNCKEFYALAKNKFKQTRKLLLKGGELRFDWKIVTFLAFLSPKLLLTHRKLLNFLYGLKSKISLKK